MTTDRFVHQVDPGRARQTELTPPPPADRPRPMSERRGTRVQLDEAMFPTGECLPLEETGDADASAGTGPKILIAINVPLNQQVRLNKIGWGADVSASSAFVTWTALVNGIAVPGYTNEPAALGSLRVPTDIIVVALGPALIQIQASCSATFLFHVVARVSGWRITHGSLSP